MLAGPTTKTYLFLRMELDHYAYESPHTDKSTRMCVCICLCMHVAVCLFACARLHVYVCEWVIGTHR